MGDCPGSAAAQVVRIRTVDRGETVVDHGFVEVCSKVKKMVEEAGPCREVTVDIPDVNVDGLHEASKYWEASKAHAFNSGTYLRPLVKERPKDFMDLSTAAYRLGYDLLFQEWVKEYKRELHSRAPSFEEREKWIPPESWVKAATESLKESGEYL